MDVLLTPVVNRFLRRFIKQAAGQEVSQLRVSLSRGSVALHHLELNLDELTAQLPVTVRRAYARQLTISVPWASFTSQPLQVSTSKALSGGAGSSKTLMPLTAGTRISQIKSNQICFRSHWTLWRSCWPSTTTLKGRSPHPVPQKVRVRPSCSRVVPDSPLVPVIESYWCIQVAGSQLGWARSQHCSCAPCWTRGWS